MQFSRLKTATALLAASVAVCGVAASAQASIGPGSANSPAAVVDDDPFNPLIQDSEVTFADGNVAWEWGGRAVTPRITGTLHVVKGDDADFRVRVVSYDKDGNVLGRAYDDKDGHPRHSDDPKDYTVDMTGVAGPDVHSVRVALEKKGLSDTWQTRQASEVEDVDTFEDSFTILGAGIDVGGAGFASGSPTDPAIVSWKIGDDGALTASFRGYLHLRTNYPAPGRIVIRSLDPTGAEHDRDEGAAHGPADNGTMDTLAVDSADGTLVVEMQAYVADPVTLQSSWQVVSSTTVNVAH
jgi:hypothetical protein